MPAKRSLPSAGRRKLIEIDWRHVSAVLDTNVLWSSLQRDFLLSLAAERTYSPKWSTAILDELIFHEAEKLTKRGTPADEAKHSAERLIGQVSTASDDAMVTDWEPLEDTYGLLDPDNEQVLAAAIMCGAELLVTENLRHFSASKLPAPVRAIPARDFVNDTVRAHSTQSCRAVVAICDRSGRHGPKLTAADFLAIFVSEVATVEVEVDTITTHYGDHMSAGETVTVFEDRSYAEAADGSTTSPAWSKSSRIPVLIEASSTRTASSATRRKSSRSAGMGRPGCHDGHVETSVAA